MTVKIRPKQMGGNMLFAGRLGMATTEARLDSKSICARIAAGDRSAESELIATFGRTLRFILNRRYRDHELKQDIFQETFAVVIENLRRANIVSPDSLPAYIRGTALNLARNHLRREARPELHGKHGLEGCEAQLDQWEYLHREQLNNIVCELIKELKSERDRAILIRFYLHDEDKSTICRDLALEVDHFYRVLHRARRRLKQKIERLGGMSLLTLANFCLTTLVGRYD